MTTAIETSSRKGAIIWHDPRALRRIEPRLFDPAWLLREGHHRGHSTGRNQAHFLHFEGLDMVLRHYWRGGLIGRVNRDLFLRGPVGRSRAMQEFRLLQDMCDAGLPVPRPIAARRVAAGACYRADLITQRIPDTRTLADRLRAAALPEGDWARIGETVARMHAFGVDHSDLNCRNILLDGSGRVWLIDFDKCRRRPEGRWQARNLARLRRSLEKESALRPGLNWSEAAWAALVAGHAGARP